MMLRLRKCPCCFSFNLFFMKSHKFENKFKNFLGWKIKEKFDCRKCKETILFFVEEKYNLKKLIWSNGLKCEEKYYDQLFYLYELQSKFLNKKNVEYFNAVNKIRNIKRQIIKDKNELKSKNKIYIPIEVLN